MAGKNMNRRKEDILNNLFSGKGHWQPAGLFGLPSRKLGEQPMRRDGLNQRLLDRVENRLQQVPPEQKQSEFGRPRWEDIQQSRETLERDRSLFNKISPFNVQRSTIPELEEVERSGQMYRGAFKPDSWEGPKGEVYNTPTDQMGPPKYQPDGKQPSYDNLPSGPNNPLSREEIDQLMLLKFYGQDKTNKATPPPQQLRQPTIWDYLKSLKRNVQ